MSVGIAIFAIAEGNVLAISPMLPALQAQATVPFTAQISIVQSSATQSGRSLLQQGIDRYQSAQFSEAITLWQQSLSALQREEDTLGQSLALSNLSLAYQQTGQLSAAETAIVQSLALLESPDLSAQSSASIEILAKALNTQGNLLFSQGQAQSALQVWQQATRHYQAIGNRQGVVLSQLNQAKALQELGFSARALALLQQVSQQINQDADLEATGLRELGEAYRRIGELEQARQLLQANVSRIQQPDLKGAVLIELGNTEAALSDRAIAIGQRRQAETYANAAVQSYQGAIQTADAATLQLQARLNQLRLFIENGQWSSVENVLSSIPPLFVQLSPGRTAIDAQLNFAASLTCLKLLSTTELSAVEATCISPERRELIHSPNKLPLPEWRSIAQRVMEAVEQSRFLKDSIAESEALGQLGHLYEINGQWEEAEQLTQQALLRLEGIQAPEVAYQWSWQLGRLSKQRGKTKEAIVAYKEAIRLLEAAQQDLFLVNLESRFSFRDRVEPVYREFVELLLTPVSGKPPEQDNLKLAIQTIDALQLVEFRNFLECNLPLVRIDNTAIDPAAAKIYPIVLTNRLAVILEIAGQPLAYYTASVKRSEFEAMVKQLRRYLTEPGQTPEVLQEAQKLYQWLVAPLEPTLAQQPQIKTLVFVPDGELRNIPMGVLYDGQQYLIEKQYGIAIAPRLELFQPRPISDNLTILAGGVGIPQVIRGTSFSEIRLLKEEIDQIPSKLLDTPPLLNQSFTTGNIQQRLQTGRYSAIHWKTHGIFSSDPTETFIVAYRSSIRTSDLIQLVQSVREIRSEPLELLILSACETARGDNRAVLGMAGTAMNAGASSILSTLWRADDTANTALMAEFYRALSQPGTSRATALQQAQVALKRDYGYSAPYVWATYVLVGNWL